MLLWTVLIAGILLSLMYLYRPMRVKMRMDWEALKLLFKTGLPIFGLDYMKNSCSTLDRVVLLRIGGVKDVGIYSLASVALTTMAALPVSLASYVYPRMSYKSTARVETLGRCGMSASGSLWWRSHLWDWLRHAAG